MMKWKKYSLMVAVGIMLSLTGSLAAEASDIVTGRAIIENGNTSRAVEMAKRDAMRSYVEEKVGVKIDSTTETVNNMLVRDRILANSEGYVMIKRIVDEYVSGNVCVVSLELEADDKKLRVLPQELKTQLEIISDRDTSRSGVQVAIIGEDEYHQLKELSRLNRYMASKMEETGFKIIANDAVMAYLVRQHQLGMTDPLKVNLEVRRLARNNRTEENAILRGDLSTEKINRMSENTYQAVVHASFELIGLDTNNVSTFARYFFGVGTSREEAERRANEQAVQEAVQALGMKAVSDVQSEQQGGIRKLKLSLRFAGITDTGQRARVMAALDQLNCRIIRSSFNAAGRFQVFAETGEALSQGEFTERLLKQLPEIRQAADNEQEYGNTRLSFTF